MGSRFLKILFPLFPAYVSCLGNYEGSMPAVDVQRVSSHTFPLTGPEVKQIGQRRIPTTNWNDLSHNSLHQPHYQDPRGNYDHLKENLFVGSNVKSYTKDCQTQAKSDSQEKNKPSASIPKYGFSGFSQSSAQYESRTATNAFKNVQPYNHLASTSSQSGSILMRTLKVPESKRLKPSRGETSYGVPNTIGSSSAFVVNSPKNAYGHMEFNSEVTKDPFARGPNTGSTISGHMSHQHGSSKESQSNKVQTASSSYGPLLKGTSVYSSTKPKKQSHAELKYTKATTSVVSSAPIFVVQGGGSAQGHRGYSGPPGSAKPLVPSHVDYYQASQASRDSRRTASSQGKPWNEPLHHSTSGTQYSPNHEPRKPSENDCRDKIAKSIASSGEIILKSPESAQRKKLPPHYEATHPKIQQTYNIQGRPNQLFKPMFPSRSGAQQDVTKSSIASSGAILMQAPTSGQGRTGSNKPKVQPSYPERKITSAISQTAHQYQPFKVTQNSRNVQPATSIYTSSSQTGYQAFSSVTGTSYKPSSGPLKPSTSGLGFSGTNPNIGGSNEINTVHVRLHKPPASSFGHIQNKWSSDDISSSAFQSSLTPSYLGQRPGQNVQTPPGSSAPQYYGSKGVQSKFIKTQGKSYVTRPVTIIPSEFGRGAIRRLSPTLSSYYRQGEHNEHQVNRLDSSAPKCEVTKNSYTGFGQQDSLKFQEVNLSV